MVRSADVGLGFGGGATAAIRRMVSAPMARHIGLHDQHIGKPHGFHLAGDRKSGDLHEKADSGCGGHPLLHRRTRDAIENGLLGGR